MADATFVISSQNGKMSEPRNNSNEKGRKDWVKGRPSKVGDELSRRADSGRRYLSGEEEANDLLGEIDDGIDDLLGEERAEAESDPVIRSLKPQRGSRRGQLALAASVLLLLALSTWGLNSFLSPGNEALVTAYFRHFDQDLVTTTMGAETAEAVDPELKTAMDAYGARDYNRAVSLLTDYLQRTDARPEARLYLGVSQLALGRTEASLTSLTAAQNSAYQPAAVSWYLALGYLRMDNDLAARQELENLAQGNSLFRDRAAQLLEEL